MSPLRAFHLGLMTPDHHLYEACLLLSCLYDELKDLHRTIEEAYNQRDDQGFYDIDHKAICNMLEQKNSLYPRIDTIEAYIKEHEDK